MFSFSTVKAAQKASGNGEQSPHKSERTSIFLHHVCCFIWLSENPPALRVNILIIIFTQNQPEIFLKKHIKHQFPVLPIFAALQVFIMLRPSLALRARGKDETGTALTTFAEQT